MQDVLEGMISKFNEKIQTDEKLQKDLQGYERTILIDITDGSSYFTTLKDNHVDPFKEGTLDDADIIITSDEATMRGLINKEIDPIKAFLITKQLKVKASLEDKLRLRKFFA